MELFGIPLHDLALYVAGLVAALWGGSKVPWKAAIAKMLGMLPKPTEADPAITVNDEDAAPGSRHTDVMRALQVLHEANSDAEYHRLVSEVEADYWQRQADEKRDAGPIRPDPQGTSKTATV